MLLCSHKVFEGKGHADFKAWQKKKIQLYLKA